MSQRNESTILILTLFATIGLVGLLLWWFAKQLPSPIPTPSSPTVTPATPSSVAGSVATLTKSVTDRISLGEKILVPAEGSENLPFKTLKQAGVNAILAGKNDEAVSQLQGALQQNSNAPETLIYLNNARIGNKKAYTIGVVAPIGSDPNGSQEILRGVAQAQNEINQAGGINSVLLKVAIANDDNNEETAKQIATALVNNPEVLGVVGHWASQVTLAAAPVYDFGRLVAISPISTAVKLSRFSHYVFRTVPSDYVAARALADHMLSKLQLKNAAVFFNSQSTYSQSLKSEFVTAVSLGGGQVSREFDLSDPSFNAAQSVEQARSQGAQLLMLAANTGTLDKAMEVVQANQKRLSLLGGDDVYDLNTLKKGGEAAVAMVLAVPWHIESDPKSDFPRQSRQLWGGANVNWRTAMAYDAAQALIAALKRSPSRTGIQQTLESPNFSTRGASGTISFSPSGDRNGPVQLVKIIPANPSRSGTGYDFVPVPR